MNKTFREKKGFTLAELLIVVAIIGVLVAISIPIFSAQLAKARLATNQANARAAEAYAASLYLDDPSHTFTVTYDAKTGTGKATQQNVNSYGNTQIQPNISEWKTTDKVTGIELGKKVISSWNVSFNSNGEIVGYSSNDNGALITYYGTYSD